MFIVDAIVNTILFFFIKFNKKTKLNYLTYLITKTIKLLRLLL